MRSHQLVQVLVWLREHNLKMNPKKCIIGTTEVEILGLDTLEHDMYDQDERDMAEAEREAAQSLK